MSEEKIFHNLIKDLKGLQKILAEKERQIEELQKILAEKKCQIEELQKILAEKKCQIEELKRQKDELSQFNLREIERLKSDYEKRYQETEEEIKVLEGKLAELIAKIKVFTSLPVQIGRFVSFTAKGTVIILDNSRRAWEVQLLPDLSPEELREGDEIKYATNEFGTPTVVFEICQPRLREEEIVVVKDLIGDYALVVLPGDTLKLANISKAVKGKLEKGEEVFYNPAVNYIIEKVPKTAEKVDLKRVVKKTYQDIGGLEDELRKVREVVELPLKHPEIFEKVGISAPKGIILIGPPGCGKTLIGQAVANETSAFFIYISGSEIMSPYPGEAEAKLRGIFEAARRNAPAIIFFDEIDSIAQKRKDMHTGQPIEQRVVNQLLSLMQGLTSREQVIVIAATNRPDVLDEALRRRGRFDREIVIHIPDRDGRLEILKIHSKNMPLAPDVSLEDLADRTHGFTGADLEGLCQEAAMSVLKDIDIDKIDSSTFQKITVTSQHFELALAEMKPSFMREVAIQKPTETWADVGGLDEVKQELEMAILWPLRYPELSKQANYKPVKGVLLHGPPGCGKTLIARALANECGVNFIAIKGSEPLSKWFSQSEENIRELFKLARQAAPCVLFFDEIDALGSVRDSGLCDAKASNRTTSQLLTELDGIEELRGVFVLAATNRIDLVDEAFYRPGRFDKRIFVPPPDEEARRKIFEIHTRGKPLAEDVDLAKLAKITVLPAGTEIAPGYRLKVEARFSGAVIYLICQRATLKAMIEFIATHDPKREYENFQIFMKHFEEALEEMIPLVKVRIRERVSEIEKTSSTTANIPDITEEDIQEII